MIFTSSKLFDGTPTSGGKDYLGKGEGNDAYGNYLEDLTIDVGRGNPGAIAIDHLGNNFGALRRLRIIDSSGNAAVGISLDRKWPGPLLVKDVEIIGFDTGVSVSHPEYHVTIYNLILRGQRRYGLLNSGNSVSIRRLHYEGAGVAISNKGTGGLIVADDIRVLATGDNHNWMFNAGIITHRGVRVGRIPSTGEGVLPTYVSVPDGTAVGSVISESWTADWVLPDADYPEAPQFVAEDWTNVADFGVLPNIGTDSTDGIEQAIRSGAKVLYFPSGKYLVSAPIVIPPSLQRIVGLHSAISITATRRDGFARELGIIEVRTDGSPFFVDGLALDNAERGDQVGIRQLGQRPVVFAGHGLLRY